MRQLPSAQAEQLRAAARALGDVDILEQQEVLDEFLRQNSGAARHDDGGVELAISGDARQARHEPSPARVASSPKPSGRVFEFLHDSEAEELARLLQQEHPQTIALVLAHLSAERSSETLLCLPKQLQQEVVRRLVDLDEANPAALEAVKRNLETKLRAHIEGKKRRASGLATVHQILRAAGPIAEHELRKSLAAEADLAELLGKPERTLPQAAKPSAPAECRLFEELTQLGDKDLAIVLVRADRACLELALAGCAVRFAERALRLLPGRESKRLRKALQNLGPLRLSDIERAQDELVRLATRLDDDGAIDWPVSLVGGVA